MLGRKHGKGSATTENCKKTSDANSENPPCFIYNLCKFEEKYLLNDIKEMNFRSTDAVKLCITDFSSCPSKSVYLLKVCELNFCM